MSQSQDNNTVDKVGIWTSGLCAVHCLALPVLLPLLPAVGGMFFAQSWFERSILSLSILIGLWALLTGFRRHHRKIYPIFALLAGGFIYWHKHAFGEAYEPFVIAVGASLIIAAHLVNIRLCSNCRDCTRECQQA